MTDHEAIDDAPIRSARQNRTNFVPAPGALSTIFWAAYSPETPLGVVRALEDLLNAVERDSPITRIRVYYGDRHTGAAYDWRIDEGVLHYHWDPCDNNVKLTLYSALNNQVGRNVYPEFIVKIERISGRPITLYRHPLFHIHGTEPLLKSERSVSHAVIKKHRRIVIRDHAE